MATGAAGRGQNSGRLNYLVIYLLVSLSLWHAKSRLTAPVFSMIWRIIASPLRLCNCKGDRASAARWCNAIKRGRLVVGRFAGRIEARRRAKVLAMLSG